MHTKLALFYHPLCPFAQRILHVINYKGIEVTLNQLDLSQKNEWYLKINPDKFAPALQIITETKPILLRDSIIISQYLETLKSPYLYPQVSAGKVNPLEKALIDMKIESHVEPLRKIIGLVYNEPNPTPVQLSQFKSIVEKVNFSVLDGRFFTFQLLGKDELSFIDLMALPLIERIIAFKDMNLKFYESCEIGSIINWYNNLSSLSFVKNSQNPLQRYVSLRSSILNQSYKGLVLPLSNYDSPTN